MHELDDHLTFMKSNATLSVSCPFNKFYNVFFYLEVKDGEARERSHLTASGKEKTRQDEPEWRCGIR